ncbi:MAG: helix-turn-helix domain-containing protein [Salinivirgaceae bacterium]|nr:helix-turn-helix domain-containing protein [Salinivirgaceae bacterium]
MKKNNHRSKASQKVPVAYNPLGKRLYTLKEAAEYLGRSDWGMRELIWARKIPVVKEMHGRKIFIDVLDLENYVNKNKSLYC